MTLRNIPVGDIVRFATSRGCRVHEDAEFGARTTYRVGGRARVLIEADDPGRIAGLEAVIDDHVPVIVLGNGSNLLVSDDGFEGVVVALGVAADGGHISYESSDDSATCVVVADSQVRLPILARKTVAAGWCGLEWAVGVPGSVGGAVRMNAGGHGSDMEATILAAELLNLRTGSRREVPRSDLGLRFRGSALSDEHFVVRASLQVSSPADHDCGAELSSIVAWRRDHQPGGQNAGSVFVNPGEGNQSAGALIDGAGLRGRRIGSAEVSEKHANFIQADLGGRASDVVELMTEVQLRVKESTGITMRSEIRLVGFAADVEARFQDPHRNDASVRDAETKLRALV